jgi:hypothetical protein
MGPVERAQAAIERFVPPAWRARVPAEVVVIGGQTSRADPGLVQLSAYHARFANPSRSEWIVLHEYAHVVALAFSADASPPAGFARPGDRELWANCLADAWAGYQIDMGGSGYQLCSPDLIAWARAWSDAGPPA